MEYFRVAVVAEDTEMEMMEHSGEKNLKRGLYNMRAEVEMIKK